MTAIRVIGIDPAPGKGLAAWHDDQSQESVSAKEAKQWIAAQVKRPPIVIAWDSPLSFCRSLSLTMRPVEKVVKKFIKEKVKEGHLESKAVSVRPFSQCQHWTISCEALGLPYGEKPDGTRLADVSPKQDAKDTIVLEVHPAVTLAIWWLEKIIERVIDFPMPAYKRNALACGNIAEQLSFPAASAENDDTLDAYVAWRMGRGFLDGTAVWVGTPEYGGFVLPRTANDRWKLSQAVALEQQKMQKEFQGVSRTET